MNNFIKKFVEAWRQASDAESEAAPLPAKEAYVPTTRDKAALDYFLSDKFHQAAKQAVTIQLIQYGENHIKIYNPEIRPKAQDIPALETVSEKLKKDFPEINRVSIVSNEIVFDTLTASQRKKLDPHYGMSVGGP